VSVLWMVVANGVLGQMWSRGLESWGAAMRLASGLEDGRRAGRKDDSKLRLMGIEESSVPSPVCSGIICLSSLTSSFRTPNKV
jgi:hypothetical protein